MMELTHDEINRYTQQIKLRDIGESGQTKLKNARVLCVGAGGLASPLLLYLAAAGVGTLGIVDDDIVEVSNLQRQILYDTTDVDSKKVIVAKQALSLLNPNVNIIPYLKRLDAADAKELIAEYDIIADCSDNFATRYLINDICYALKKPFVFASVSEFMGQCSTFDGQQNPCFRCLFPMHSGDVALSCNIGGILGVLPGLLGIIQATEVLKYLLGVGKLLTGRLLSIDAMTMQFTEFKLTRDPECDLCAYQKKNNIVENSPSIFISPRELHKKLQNGENVFLLDVRTLKEHKTFNIGGKLIPLVELPERLQELNPKDEIVVYCHLGQRSVYAAELLKNADFRNVRSLAGGLKAWQNQSY